MLLNPELQHEPGSSDGYKTASSKSAARAAVPEPALHAGGQDARAPVHGRLREGAGRGAALPARDDELQGHDGRRGGDDALDAARDAVLLRGARVPALSLQAH
jgi:hypothetical protein